MKIGSLLESLTENVTQIKDENLNIFLKMTVSVGKFVFLLS